MVRVERAGERSGARGRRAACTSVGGTAKRLRGDQGRI